MSDPLLKRIFNLMYPVGSVYASVNATSPAVLFGGTWTKIEGRFLWATGSTPKSTGGSRTTDSTALTLSQIPSHSHSVNITSGGGGNHYHTLRYGGAAGSPVNISYEAGSTKTLNLPNWAWVEASYANLYSNYSGDHTHAVSGTTGANGSGGGHTHTYMPPYFEVYMWYRTG